MILNHPTFIVESKPTALTYQLLIIYLTLLWTGIIFEKLKNFQNKSTALCEMKVVKWNFNYPLLILSTTLMRQFKHYTPKQHSHAKTIMVILILSNIFIREPSKSVRSLKCKVLTLLECGIPREMTSTAAGCSRPRIRQTTVVGYDC